MKKILLLWLCCIPCLIFAENREKDNLSIEKGKVVWQKIFTTPYNMEKTKALLLTHVAAEEIKEFDNKIVFSCNKFHFNYQDAGFGRAKAPLYYQNMIGSAFVTIDFKEGKYRVTVRNIVLEEFKVEALTPSYHSHISSHYLEEFVLKKKNSAFKAKFYKYDDPILNTTFAKMFQLIDDSKW
ncbi:hypothetical protein K4L44_05500 [Halosquirtibacter laminarini]|uniref:Uncharacterized protein n=1 Tax=Halosquirtibacter laminarini TaxID=3374600 RepID=A0AC61NPS5_9BACT|nr:hypothetical protein K4L44_05500 [Prolixibacteraceae bacterium]